MSDKTNGKTSVQEERAEIAALIRTTPPGDLPPAARMMLEERKIRNRIAAAIAGLSWGKNLDLPARVALAEWGRRQNVDITQEVHILGDRLYLNAQFYFNRLQQLHRSGEVEYMYVEHVHVDKRLDPTDPKDVDEIRRRRDLRIQFNIPDAAVGAAVAHLKLRALAVEFSGAKWCGGGTRKNDPVGDAAPVETSETRAYRRVCRLVVSHLPQIKKEVEIADDDAALNVSAMIAESKAKQEVEIAMELRQLSRPHVADAMDSYEGKDKHPALFAVTEADEEDEDDFQDDRDIDE